MSHIEQTKARLSPILYCANGIVSKERIVIKPGTQDQVEGDLRELKGKGKGVAGKLLNDPDLEADGEAEEIAGKIQNKIGQVKEVFGQ
jgi:uncharacterized protein YjbJ (UPF0337 family)